MTKARTKPAPTVAELQKEIRRLRKLMKAADAQIRQLSRQIEEHPPLFPYLCEECGGVYADCGCP